MKRCINYALLLFAAATLPACQKVIDVNLNDSDPQYVVEGNVDDGPGPYTVKITRSVNFSNDNTFPAVAAALVVISDITADITDTLKEQSAGLYATTVLTGIPGHEYRLYIQSGSRIFTATSVVPAPVPVDSVGLQKSVFGGTNLYPVPVYRDPITPGNNYRITASVNHIRIKSWRVRNDAITNGQVSQSPFFYDTGDDSGNPVIHSGDSVFVNLQTIDKGVYEFYRTLDATQDQNAAAIANPISNIQGGAMGYFSAGAVQVRGILAK